MTFGSILAFVIQRSSPTTFDILPGGYAILATAPVLLADCVTTGYGLKNGVHCSL